MTEAEVRKLRDREWSFLIAPEVRAVCDSWLAQERVIEAARHELKNAHDEATHGATANAEYIDRCVQNARRALDLVAGGEPETCGREAPVRHTADLGGDSPA